MSKTMDELRAEFERTRPERLRQKMEEHHALTRGFDFRLFCCQDRMDTDLIADLKRARELLGDVIAEMER